MKWQKIVYLFICLFVLFIQSTNGQNPFTKDNRRPPRNYGQPTRYFVRVINVTTENPNDLTTLNSIANDSSFEKITKTTFHLKISYKFVKMLVLNGIQVL